MMQLLRSITQADRALVVAHLAAHEALRELRRLELAIAADPLAVEQYYAALESWRAEAGSVHRAEKEASRLREELAEALRESRYYRAEAWTDFAFSAEAA
ncbi:MAG TPA: hypothetical protein VEI97_14480 [bacterium]|nr:hypothetical protein [bacterium]